ncbi:MAG: pyridoxal phosphate-dependent aminotransferase [Clostridiales bacterium]|nr:pyridoxal phosphate-dependent aminotransferase [Clostridiales bacterium]
MGISRKAAGIAPSATLALNARVAAMKASGEKVIGFASGEPDFDTPVAIRDAMKAALDSGKTRYTAASGAPELRNAIKDKLKRENGLDYDISQIVVSNGAKHSIFNAFFALLNDGDEVIIPTPCWVSYPEMVRMCGGVPVFAQTTEEDNFVLKPSHIEAAITEKTKVFMLTSPSNPNGSCWGVEDLQALADLAVKHDFYIMTDEIYEHLLYNGEKNISIASFGEKVKERTITINGVSKTYAMTGFRIGYAAGPKDVMNAIAACQSQATSNPNTPSQYAVVKALTMDQGSVEVMRKAFMERRDVLVEGLNAIDGISCLKPDGAFYVMMNVKKLIGKKKNGLAIDSCSTFAQQLLEHEKVAVVPGAEFHAPGFCRLTYALSMEELLDGVKRIRAFAESLT